MSRGGVSHPGRIPYAESNYVTRPHSKPSSCGTVTTCETHRMASEAASFIPTTLPVRHDNRILEPCRSTARGPSRTVCTLVRPRCTLTSEASGGCRRLNRRPRANHLLPIPKHPPRTLKTAFARQAIAHTVWKLPRERPRDRTRRAVPPMQRMAKVKAGVLGVKGGGVSRTGRAARAEGHNHRRPHSKPGASSFLSRRHSVPGHRNTMNGIHSGARHKRTGPGIHQPTFLRHLSPFGNT